jgi:ribulose-phosphate 3-epimerase
MKPSTVSRSTSKTWNDVPKPGYVPSLLACDFGKLDAEIQIAESLGLSAVQWDVMDGHFVPNITYGPSVIRSCRAKTPILFDAHLMIGEPEKHLEAFLDAGCDSITIHLESTDDPRGCLHRIRDQGRSAGLAIKPGTPVESMEPFFEAMDLALIMSVEPGFGGQEFLTSSLNRLEWLKSHCPPHVLIQVDGGVNVRTAASAVAAGATLLVVGSAFFGAENRAAALTELHKVIPS